MVSVVAEGSVCLCPQPCFLVFCILGGLHMFYHCLLDLSFLSAVFGEDSWVLAVLCGLILCI